MGVHPRAAEGFSRAAAAYERGRPGYPDQAVDWLAARLGLGEGSRVADVGAGTGKLTRMLVARGARVVALEPVAQMASVLSRAAPGAQVVRAVAEALPLASGWARALTVAQAFHWFDWPAALADAHRVLGPGGGLALVWNRRRLDQPLQAALEEALGPWRRGVPSHGDGAWRRALEASPLFGPPEEATFPYRQRLDPPGLVDRVCSTSFVASLPPDRLAEVRRRVAGLAEGWGGEVVLDYDTEIQVCRRV